LSDAEPTTNPDDASTRKTDDTRERAPHEPSAPRRGRVSSGLALILALAALSVSGYLWYALIYERPALTSVDLPSTLASFEQRENELRGTLDKTTNQIAALTETQNTLKTAVDRVQAELGRNQTQWIVNETEQLLLIANRRLQLARDANSALAALRAADRQLELLASPSLLPVRREIAKEITELETLDHTDTSGIALRLGSLADGLDQLPLAPDLRAKPEQVATAEAGSGAAAKSTRSIWHDILGLVQIRRHDTVQRPLLEPEQQYFLRQNLRLLLYGAQHALLQGNVATYQQNLDAATRWMGEYFDTESAAVDAVQQELKTLRATPVMNALPDITASLDMLRKAAARQNQP
jgi:uroporphyrin-III C-methyltransferase